jgi:hypothetical protein
MAAFMAEVTLNLSCSGVSHSIFAVSLTVAICAGYNLSSGFAAENVFWEDFAGVWAIYDLVFQFLSLRLFRQAR